MSVHVRRGPRMREACLFALLLTVASVDYARGQQMLMRESGTARVAVRDKMRLAMPADVQLGGLLGARYEANAVRRLPVVDEAELLGGFRKRPGSHPWIGEHVGKWLHAACLTYACTGDAGLRAKLDRVVSGLLATQEPDGYLGTYESARRFGLYPGADWDVWVHKYCILGLLAYHQITGSQEALEGARRAAALMQATFGPGRKSILGAGTHVGMAATSVLEPIMLLYRVTGEARWLDLARYIVRAWDEPGGPRVLSALLETGSVRKTANAKAYEMLSNLTGLAELYRVTGEPDYLRALLAAWQDIVAKRLYITGTGSSHELWQDDHVLPNGTGANVGETCVTVSWIQLNAHLLRLTGEARFADQYERSIYNHLLGAQKPSGEAWCYYTALDGAKPYGSITNCCLSSGPRGVSLLPCLAYGSGEDWVAVNLYTPSRAGFRLRSGALRLMQSTSYPFDGAVTINILDQTGAGTVGLRLRVPPNTRLVSVQVNGRSMQARAVDGGYQEVRRRWRRGDTLTVKFEIPLRVVMGEHGNAGRAAVMVGPVVLAADDEHNPRAGSVARLAFAEAAPRASEVRPVAGRPGHFTAPGRLRAVSGPEGALPVYLLPFYDAGAGGGRVIVWLPTAALAARAGASLFAFAEESRSRRGNQSGSIVDEDPGSFVVTYDGTRQAEDWYAVELPVPQRVGRVVFRHGRSFHDGGWFDTSGGKPRVQVKRSPDGPWIDVAVLSSYPETTSTVDPRIADGTPFEVRFEPVETYGIRVVGVPSSGDNPAQAFSSCGELSAYAR